MTATFRPATSPRRALVALAVGAAIAIATTAPRASLAQGVGSIRAVPDVPATADASPGPGLPAPRATSTRANVVTARPEAVPAFPDSMVPVEVALLHETNRDREAAGVGRLVPDPDLLPFARSRAAAQVGVPSLSHLDGGGALAFLSLIQRAGIPHRVAGENLVRLPGPFATVPPRAERALMSSPTHRANILDPRYGRLAVGMAADRDGRVILAQLFRDGP